MADNQDGNSGDGSFCIVTFAARANTRLESSLPAPQFTFAMSALNYATTS